MNLKSLVPNLAVADVNKTVDYYTQKLGFELVMSVPTTGELVWAMVRSGEVIINFQGETSLKEEYAQLHSHKIGGALTLYVQVEGIHDLHKSVKSHGVSIAKELNNTFYGATEFAIVDCNGYVLTFAETTIP